MLKMLKSWGASPRGLIVAIHVCISRITNKILIKLQGEAIESTRQKLKIWKRALGQRS